MNDRLADLGWSAFFSDQLDPAERGLTPARVAAVHRARLDLLTPSGALSIDPGQPGPFAVGDWLLVLDGTLIRRLDRASELSRKAAGTGLDRQLIAANVDTVFVTTSCNADFNPGRLERYLALAAEAGARAVILLTKADLVEDPEPYLEQARALAPGQQALALNGLDAGTVAALRPWTGPGQTVVLLGSSGVGKTTLTNLLTGRQDPTQGIRAHDAHGRHTTTHRALQPVTGGGWLIDTPGIRELQLTDVAEGIATVFAELEELAQQCRFRDCAHQAEPGCAVQAAIAEGRLDPRRLASWDKLRREDALNSQSLAQTRAQGRRFSKMVKSAVRAKTRMRGGEDD
ncbi:MAG: ribosome small subunit-dependent GTPase A [Paracoccaceae bacterium]